MARSANILRKIATFSVSLKPVHDEVTHDRDLKSLFKVPWELVSIQNASMADFVLVLQLGVKAGTADGKTISLSQSYYLCLQSLF